MRYPDTERAKAVEALGADLVTGDLHDRDAVVRAATGVRAVFSVQMPALAAEGFDFDGEVAQAVNLIQGAQAAGVPQFVHTSTSGAGQHTEAPGWIAGQWGSLDASLGAKSTIQDRVRAARLLPLDDPQAGLLHGELPAVHGFPCSRGALKAVW
ncbi:SDR family oxidoreductase [Nonomuraea ferruginea]